ncbi:MAG: Na-translocating system protein MpsB, partial [Actinomycetota bacterium]|nr:Na-translocating system protein MpsB [Actinomycetota bacterium]
MVFNVTNEMRHHLKHEVDHFSHLLAGQGPISTFVHHNTLHGLQHLPFEEAVTEAHRILGGRGYLSNEQFRSFYAKGRISDEDIAAAFESRPFPEESLAAGERRIKAAEIRRVHLLRGIEPLDPARLRFEVYERGATRRLRDDMPDETRAAIIEKASDELARSLERVGREWTLSDWMGIHLNLDPARRLRAEVRSAMEGGEGKSGGAEAGLRALGIPDERWDGYLECIDRRFGAAPVNEAEREQIRRLWLDAEARLVKALARRHFGIRGTFSDIAAHFERNPEAYAVLSLWGACLAAHGLEDPLSTTDPKHFGERNPDGAAERLEERFRYMERWGGPPVPLTDELRTAVRDVVYTEMDRLEGSSEDEASTLEAAHLCWLVLHDLGATGLNRRGLASLEILLSLSEERAEHPGLMEELHRRDPRRRMHEFIRRNLEEEMDRLGRDKSHSDFLKEITGEDLSGRVNEYMIKRCAAFLDEGLAAWRMPGRALGFYDAWKSLAGKDRSFEFDDLPGWRDVLHHLPALARDAVIQRLRELGVPEEDWGDYLGRLIMQLPGWAGMIQWRESHPNYARQDTQPIDLIQYLAVRLFYETLLIQKICGETWRLDGSAHSLRGYFESHPSEFFARRELRQGNLPDYLAEQARTLAADRSSSGGLEDERWQTLADMIWAYRESDASSAVCGDAWRLFHLSQFLGLTGEEVRSLSEEERECLMGVVDGFPASEHGPIWLAAYERNYRDKILNALSDNRGKGRWKTRETRPKAQVVYCIDEREEAIRRHFEEINPEYETFGAAGFFGVAMQYQALDDHGTTPLCPAVVSPVNKISEVRRPEEAERLETHNTRSKWEETFHNAYWETERNSVSAYFLIHLVGLLQSVPLVGRILAPRAYSKVADKVHHRVVPSVRTSLALDAGETHALEGAYKIGFVIEEQANQVETMLRNLGLTYGFARIVLFSGHGSASINNPHESAHDCGACGGKHGGPNARAFAAMTNRPEVRSILRERDIEIPDDTWFVGSQHNTANELYTYSDIEDIPEMLREDFESLTADLDEARARSAQERCRRFASAPKDVSPKKSLRHIEG